MSYRIGMKTMLPQSSLSSSTTSWDAIGALVGGATSRRERYTLPSWARDMDEIPGPSTFADETLVRRRGGGVPSVKSPSSFGPGGSSSGLVRTRSRQQPTIRAVGPSYGPSRFTRKVSPLSPSIPRVGGPSRPAPVPLPTGQAPSGRGFTLGPRRGGYRAIRPRVQRYRRAPTGVRPPRPLVLGARSPAVAADAVNGCIEVELADFFACLGVVIGLLAKRQVRRGRDNFFRKGYPVVLDVHGVHL